MSKLSKSNIKRAAHLVLFQGMKSKLHPPPLSAQKQNPAPSSVLAPPSQSSRELLWRMLKFLKPVWKTATIAGLIILARAFSEVSMVYFLSPAVTTVATGLAGSAHELNFFDWLTGAGSSAVQLRSVLLWMGLMQVVLGCMIYLRSVWDTKLSMGAVYHIRAGVYDRLQRADLAFHDRMSSGQLINRAMNDLQAVRHFVNLSVLSSLDIVASLTLYLGLLYFRSPMLMFAALFALPPLYLAIDKFSRRAQPLCYLQQQASDVLMNTLSENLSGVQVIRAFATEDQERGKYAVQNQTLLKHLLKSVHLQAALTPSLKLIATTAHIGLFAFAALLLRQGVLQIGDVLLLGATMAAVLGKLQQINAIVEAYQRAIVSSRRLFEILDLPNAVSILRPKERGLLRITQGEIEFRDLCFNHRGRRTLSEVSAKIPGGKITALVGPTGSGKTTLAGLVARFYDPDSGLVTIDGQDLRSVDVRALRERIGYVFQETFLFSSTVADNIRYGRTDVSDEMVREAARIAMADGFIESLPEGYQTLIGDRGVSLSGGQRQRLALARALVYNPDILILDDATAALDATTEEVIHERLDRALQGRTVLLIASRLSCVEKADHVIVLENGRVTQSGTPSELQSCAGHYRDIASLQSLCDEGQALVAVAALGQETA